MAEHSVFPASKSWVLLLRRMFHNPYRLLSGFVKQGSTVADIGCGPGLFTAALSDLAGAEGKVYAVDLQQEMLDKAKKRTEANAKNRNVGYVKAGTNDLNLPKGIDFALAFYMVHEVPDKAVFFRQVSEALKSGARLLVVEPKFHVSTEEFNEEETAAQNAGLIKIAEVPVIFSRGMLLEKKTR